MKRGIAAGFVLILILALTVFATAAFTKGNPGQAITKDYGPSEMLRGWINISLNNHPSNTMVETSLGNILLLDLLKKPSNTEFQYTCNPIECQPAHEAMNADLTKTFHLNANESAFFGFRFDGKNIGSFSGITLSLSSNNPESENLPLIIDFFNDGVKDWQAYSASENFGSENPGCFTIPTGQAFISTKYYCGKVKLNKAPAVEIGAYITHITGNKNVNFEMSVKNVLTGEGGECTRFATGVASGSERISCIPSNFQVKESGEYFVCLRTTKSEDDNKYKIDYEQERPCGFSGINYQNADNFYDFEIFARPKKYASSINITLNTNELKNLKSPLPNLEYGFENYIKTTYPNCSQGCVVPVKITAGVAQDISLSDAYMSFEVDDIRTDNDYIFNVIETPARIFSAYQKLYLDGASFSVPAEYGNYTLDVLIDGQAVASENISVGEVPVITILNPISTAVKYPTNFRVEVESTANISRYSWDFGDGSTAQTTTKGEASHTYNTAGTYTIKINVTDSRGKNAEKEFSISVGSASEIVPSLIEKTEMSLILIKNQMAELSAFEKQAISSSLNLDEIESKLSQVKSSITSNASESAYESALGVLIAIKIPDSIAKTASSTGLFFIPSAGNINPGVVDEISPIIDYDATKDNLYQDAILAWANLNINALMDYSEFSAAYGLSEYSFLRVFTLHVTNTGSDQAYIIIKEMAGLEFMENYPLQNASGYVYMTMGGFEEDISFSTTESVDFQTIPAFISPSLSMLTIADYTEYEKPSEVGKWVGFSVIVFFIILGALMVYTFIQIWYTRKYETSLFKDRNNLFNLVNYINDAKNKGENDNEIADKLKKTGWNSEQVRYALRKYAGKNTGLPEIIPLGKFLDELKKKEMKKPLLKPKTGQPGQNNQGNTQKKL